MTDLDIYADDETHPIPFLGKIDVFVAASDGRVDYGLVIASPKDWISDNGFSIEVTTDANILSLH